MARKVSSQSERAERGCWQCGQSGVSWDVKHGGKASGEWGGAEKGQTRGKVWQGTGKCEEEEYGSLWDRPLDLGSEGCSVSWAVGSWGFRDAGSHGLGDERLVRTEWRRQEVVCTGFCMKRSCPKDRKVTSGTRDGKSPCSGQCSTNVPPVSHILVPICIPWEREPPPHRKDNPDATKSALLWP